MLSARLLGALRPRRGSLWLRPMGARSCASDTAPAAWDAAIVSLGAARFGQPAGVTDAQSLAAARLVVFGEIHSMPPCIELLQRTASSMMAHAAAAGGTLHVVLEHLNFEQQPLLDGYAARVRVRVTANPNPNPSPSPNPNPNPSPNPNPKN